MHVEEFASDMGQASQLDRAFRKQCLVADEIVHHQMAVPALQEVARVLAGPAGLVVEDDYGRAGVQHIGTVRPQIGMPGLAVAGVELAHLLFVAGFPF